MGEREARVMASIRQALLVAFLIIMVTGCGATLTSLDAVHAAHRGRGADGVLHRPGDAGAAVLGDGPGLRGAGGGERHAGADGRWVCVGRGAGGGASAGGNWIPVGRSGAYALIHSVVRRHPHDAAVRRTRHKPLVGSAARASTGRQIPAYGEPCDAARGQ